MKFFSQLLLITLLFFTACQPNKVEFKDALCITHISIIDPIDGLKEDQTVVIKGGKIIKVAPSTELALANTNKIIDGTGKYLMPGLWDAHVHFAFMEDLAPSMFDLFLAYGITSVRDTGGEIGFVKKWKDKSLADPTSAPRVMIAGPLLDGMPNVYDGSDPGHPPLSEGLPTVEALINYVHKLDSLGVDLLKAYEMLTPEQFEALAQLAQEKGLKVTGHVPLSMDVISASNAGLNSMEHMRNLELSCASNSDELWEERRQLLKAGQENPGSLLRSSIHQAQRQKAIENYDEDKAQKVLQVLAQNDTWQIPTLALNTASVERPFARPQFQESFAYLPDTIEEQWTNGVANFIKEEASPFRKQYSQWMFDMVGKVHEAKIPIMAGTDCPIFFLTPGRSLHEELAVLVKAGLTPLEVIKTATVNPAMYFGLEAELGNVREQMWADLVILTDNPLENIHHTQSIDAVIKGGKLYDRLMLDGILGRLMGDINRIREIGE